MLASRSCPDCGSAMHEGCRQTRCKTLRSPSFVVQPAGYSGFRHPILLKYGFISVLVLIVGLYPTRTQAQVDEAARLFEEGNGQYERGNFVEALAQYRQALDRGYTSGALYQNIGNVYFRLDSLGQAIRYYEKARRLSPDDRLLLHNLDIARSRTARTFPELPVPFWRPWWDRLVALVGVIGLFVGGLLCYIVVAALIAYRIRTRQRSPWLRRTLTLTVLGSLVLLAAAFAASFDRSHTTRVVVVAEQATLRDAPDGVGAVLNVPEGTVLDVLNTDAGWREVRLPNGATGWLDTHALAEI